jgi:hypothetical protein
MSQGLARNKEKVIEALEPFFKLGCSILKACNYCGVPQSTVQTWIDNDPDLRVKVVAWQHEMSAQARRNWKEKLKEGDFNASEAWLRKKEKDEFSDRQEVTGKDGEKLSYNFTDEQLERIISARSGPGISQKALTGVLDSNEQQVSTELAPSPDSTEAGGSGTGEDKAADDLHAASSRQEPVG